MGQRDAHENALFRDSPHPGFGEKVNFVRKHNVTLCPEELSATTLRRLQAILLTGKATW